MPTNYNPDTDALETMQERFEREAEVDERIMRGELGKGAKTGEEVKQDWKGMDGATAWHLIDRHAEDWSDVGRMMQEWLDANSATAERDELLAAAEAIEIDAEECLDFDEFTAMLVPIDDYHKLVEAIARVKGGSCELGCTNTCEAKKAGCASECPALPWQPDSVKGGAA